MLNYNWTGCRITIDSTEVAATGFRNGDFTCRDIGESWRSSNQDRFRLDGFNDSVRFV